VTNSAILELLKEDKRVIAYRPKLSELFDSVTAAIALQEMIYWSSKKDGKPFYKFKEPCEHKLYVEGQSWCEELAFGRTEFDNALRIFGTKITKGVSKTDALAYEDWPDRKPKESHKSYLKRVKNALKYLVIYWTDSSRVTWYQVNEGLLGKVVNLLYLGKVQTLRYLKKLVRNFTQKKKETRDTFFTETNTETTTEDKDSLSPADASKAPAPEKPEPIPSTGYARPIGPAPDFHALKAAWLESYPAMETAYGQVCNIVHQLNGSSPAARKKKKNYKPWAETDWGRHQQAFIDKPVSPDELREFAPWYREQTNNGVSDPMGAQTLETWFSKFRNRPANITSVAGDTWSQGEVGPPLVETPLEELTRRRSA
jgi:hypothetical protein